MSIFTAAVREAASRRVLGIGVAISLLFVGVFWLGYTFVNNEIANESALDQAFANTVMTVLGLYAVQFLAAFLTILLAAGAVAGELDSDRALAVLARPIPRWSWLGQRAGAFATMAVGYMLVMGGGVLVLARTIAGYQPLDAVTGLALLALEMVLLMAVGTALSTRLSTVAAGSVVVALYGLAWIAGIMEFVGTVVDNDGVRRIAVAISLVMPSDALWRAASYHLQSPIVLMAQDMGEGIPFASTTPPSAALLAWAGLYVLIGAALAVRALNRRDL